MAVHIHSVFDAAECIAVDFSNKRNCIFHSVSSFNRTGDILFAKIHIIVSQNKKDTRQQATDSTHVRQGELTPYIFYLDSL